MPNKTQQAGAVIGSVVTLGLLITNRMVGYTRTAAATFLLCAVLAVCIALLILGTEWYAKAKGNVRIVRWMIAATIGVALAAGFGILLWPKHLEAELKSNYHVCCDLVFPVGTAKRGVVTIALVEVTNPSPNASIADHYELEIRRQGKDSYRAKAYPINTDIVEGDVEYVKKEDLLINKTSQAIAPGGKVCGYLLFQFPGVMFSDLHSTETGWIVSFSDVHRDRYESAAKIHSAHPTPTVPEPSEVACGNSVFDVEALRRHFEQQSGKQAP